MRRGSDNPTHPRAPAAGGIPIPREVAAEFERPAPQALHPGRLPSPISHGDASGVDDERARPRTPARHPER
jgi:hypothetical protein